MCISQRHFPHKNKCELIDCHECDTGWSQILSLSVEILWNSEFATVTA